MKDYSELTNLMERVIHKYTRYEEKKRTYGTDKLLTKAEIHTIAVLGTHPNINITSLAEMLGITKGAASQMIYKLVDKQIVIKKVSPTSDSEVMLNLSEEGWTNFNTHKLYHQQTNDEALQLLEEVPETVVRSMKDYFAAFESILDKKLNE